MENADKIEQLRKAIYASREYGERYMSDPDNWLCVHVTRYEPKTDSAGNRYIETTAMATDNELPRASVHVTLNQVVNSHLSGNWDTASVVVMAPYKDVVKLNGNPQEVATEDTYFIPNPDKGLVLPKSTYIIRPHNNTGELFHIGKQEATYKTDNYTDEEIATILSLSDEWDKNKYNQYMQGDVPEYDVEWILGADDKLMAAYNKSKDKKAFMRGILEEDRFILLNKLLRDVVIKAATEKMGYHFVSSHEDEVSGKVYEVAKKAGLRASSGDKGHSGSLEHDMEIEGCRMLKINNFLKEKDFLDIYEHLSNANDPISEGIISYITSDKPLPDYYSLYEAVLKEKIGTIRIRGGYCPEEKEKLTAYADKLERGGIKSYNKNLDRVLRRHAKKMREETVQILEDRKKDTKGYAMLKQRLSNVQEVRTWFDNMLGGNDGRV